jgi:2,3-bisphosphoglycerate-independent phosphoglycerate mutase
MSKIRLKRSPLALFILDGFGHTANLPSNAIARASTPTLDRCFEEGAWTLLEAAGRRVGLPHGQAGNSEVGHLNLGAGRVVEMDITRIDEALASGRFEENPQLLAAIDLGKRGALHLLGLISDGGVHSSLSHLEGILSLAARRGVRDVYLHALTDGRDTPPTSGRGYLSRIMEHMERVGVGRLATICGRYYAMDRDNRWERIERAYLALTEGRGATIVDPLAALESSYARGITDEFIDPMVLVEAGGAPRATIRSGDSVIFFNFRADRARQLTRAFTGLHFDRFTRNRILDLHFATFTQYDRALTAPILFPPLELKQTLASIFAEAEIRNLRVAETEKYPHVTYFFNGGMEKQLPWEERLMIPSPRVDTYDQQPEMSARQMTDELCRAIREDVATVYIVNYANCDMVGHSGRLEETVRAVEVVDTELGRALAEIEAKGGISLITSDHGNAELMTDPETGAPHTAHTTFPVPFLVRDVRGHEVELRANGALEDVAPTILELLGLPQPSEMTGTSLLKRAG